MIAAGVDLVEIDRIAHALSRYGTRFLKRICTLDEIVYCAGRAPQVATRFAAKEAAAKALGCGLTALAGGGVPWRDIEVVQDEGGRPHLELRGAALVLANTLGITEWSLSLSHTDALAIAVVVVSG